mmetsp:Transcript_23281/g.32160  ORF Transcript_23281/g.32160 Transcript_23281/m.32160 type:complete len:279 (+) Transcript_23281:100-936(+)
MGQDFVSYLDSISSPLQSVWYPEERLYSAEHGWWMQPRVPIAGVVLYLAGKQILVVVCRRLGTTGKSAPFFSLVLLHNLLLLLFSAVVWYQSWEVVWNAFQLHSPSSIYCDGGEGWLWQAGMGRLTFLFYLSKFYEFGDTAILIVKQKKVSLLQSYHHSGAVLVMWGLCYTRANTAMYFVCLNSMIHTFMYTYYLFSAMGIRLPGKSLITTAQISQFVFGLSISLPTFFVGVKCQSIPQLCALGVVHLYVFPLVSLFLKFYSDAYNAKHVESSRKKTK